MESHKTTFTHGETVVATANIDGDKFSELKSEPIQTKDGVKERFWWSLISSGGAISDDFWDKDTAIEWMEKNNKIDVIVEM